MYPESSLITTKFIIPRVSAKMIKRQRLFEKLDKFLEYRLTIVVAAAGYGKTALVSSWLEEKQKKTFITTWLSLDEEDNDPEYFWSYFLSSFYKIISESYGNIENAEKLYHSSDTFNKLQLSQFINIAAKIDQEILMVVDDFNAISDDKIIENMKFLIKNLPSNMHILLISRSLPKVGLERLRAEDNVLEINQNDLCFTPEETKQFLSKALKADLPYDNCNKLLHETEGWAAGIQMMTLSTRTFEDSERLNLDYHACKNNNFIFNYMAEEVFRSLKDHIKRFLLYTSILNEFSVELCNYLLDIDNSMEIINELETLNLFLVSIDNNQNYSNNWYRYHNLFREFLRNQLNNLGMKVVHQLFDKAARWYEAEKQINKSIENYIKATNFVKAAELIVKVSGQIRCRGGAKLLHKWNKSLPEAIVNNNPRLLMNSAWAASADGRTNEVLEYISLAKACKSDHEDMKCEIAALTSTNITSLYVHDLDKILEECKIVIKDAEPKQFLVQLIVFNMAKIHLLKGEPIEAVRCFEKCLSMSIQSGQSYISILSNKGLVTWRKLKGDNIQAEKECIEFISGLKKNGDIVLPIAGVLYAELSDIYYQWNECEKAIETAKEGLKLGLAGDDIWAITENYLMLAKIYNSIGMEKKYIAAVDEIEKYLHSNEVFNIMVTLKSIKVEKMLKEGDISSVSKWLTDMMPFTKENLIIVYYEVYILKIKLYIHENDLVKASEMVDMLQNKVEKYGAYSLMVKVKILSSRISKRNGDMSKAISDLEKAIALARKYKVPRFLLDEGSWMQDMLRQIRENVNHDGIPDMVQYIDTLTVSFNATLNQNNTKANIENNFETEELLSKREIEILELIQQGETNAEISEKLFISINTVKTHLLNVYMKLDVHSRIKAVAKAKELKLI